MPCLLRYGTDSSLSLDLPPEVLVAACDAPRGSPLVDPLAAVTAALDAPLGFPPLAQATVPGDKVVLALDQGLPQAATIVAAAVRYLVARGASAGDIRILRTQADVDAGAPDPRRLLSAEDRAGLVLETHQPDVREQFSFLGRSHDDRPIYLNRALVDADLVVPIGCLRCEPALGYRGLYGGLFPTFSDAKTLHRFRNPGAPASRAELAARARREIDEVGWLLGAQFTIQVVPGAAADLLHVLAGDAPSVFEVGQQLCQAAWSYRVPRRASLVVAAIAGEPAQQTWDNLGRALATAARNVSDDGAIALCTELDGDPGPALKHLARTDDVRRAARRIRKERPRDALAASELVEATARAKVYLLSRLDESFVEDLGVVPVSGPSEIVRLAGRHKSCILLANAQHTVATPLED